MTKKLSLSGSALLVISCLSFSQARTDDINIVNKFLSPGASIAQLTEASSTTGKILKAEPAVLQSDRLPGKAGIVFAQSTEINRGKNHVLSIQSLQAEPDGYRQIFARTYYDKVLFVQDFKTIGLQQVELADGKVGLLVITSSGASLGGDIEIFTWENGLGLVNVAPTGVGGGHRFMWSEEQGVLRLQISYQKSRYDTNFHPPIVLTWNRQKKAMEIIR